MKNMLSIFYYFDAVYFLSFRSFLYNVYRNQNDNHYSHDFFIWNVEFRTHTLSHVGLRPHTQGDGMFLLKMNK